MLTDSNTVYIFKDRLDVYFNESLSYSISLINNNQFNLEDTVILSNQLNLLPNSSFTDLRFN